MSGAGNAFQEDGGIFIDRWVRSVGGKETLRFMIAGGWNTLFGYLAFVLVFFLFSRWLGLYWVIVIAYVIALPQSFLVQRYFVFRASHRAWRRQFYRFSIVNTATFLLNMTLVPVVISKSGLIPVVAQALFTLVLAVVMYLAHKKFSFN
ncbi:GtrA family protein [Stenotrophomonas sp.]|uniref:GtrA family protein n=1 Tax=Stenotrophomonas sp. TaxID=69392 RepID=UPI0028B142FD|nr:GtrA family protein [Stenotrophomonas sp.]